MDPGVRSRGMKADPPGYLWSKYEYFLMSGWRDILHSSCLHVKLCSNSTNGTEVRTNERTIEHTNGRTERRKLYTPRHKCRGYNTKSPISASQWDYVSRAKRICVFEHSVMTNFNCSCPAIQRGQGSGFLSEGSSSLTACMSEQRRFWRDCADAQARLNLRCSHRR